MNLAPTAFDGFAESASTLNDRVNRITNGVPVIGNAGLCVDSLCTTGRAGINFYCSPNPVAKVFFCANCMCGIMGGISSGTSLLTSFTGIPIAGWLGSFGARGFNRLDKYTLHMGNVTNGNITNATEIAELMS